MVRNLQGKVEVLAYSVHAEGDTQVEHYDEHEDVPSRMPDRDSMMQLTERLEKQSLAPKTESSQSEVKQNKCSTCNAIVGDAKEYRDHFKTDWHKHNLRRKTKQLPPLTMEECLADLDLDDLRSDLKDYSF